MARPRKNFEDIEFDGWDVLETMAGFYSAEDCAKKLGVSVDTLERRIKEKYSIGFAEFKPKCRELMMSNILAKQYEVAMGGNVQMLIWTGKQYCGQSDKQEIEHSGSVIKIEKQDECL